MLLLFLEYQERHRQLYENIDLGEHKSLYQIVQVKKGSHAEFHSVVHGVNHLKPKSLL